MLALLKEVYKLSDGFSKAGDELFCVEVEEPAFRIFSVPSRSPDSSVHDIGQVEPKAMLPHLRMETLKFPRIHNLQEIQKNCPRPGE